MARLRQRRRDGPGKEEERVSRPGHDQGLAQVVLQHRPEDEGQHQRGRLDAEPLHEVSHQAEQDRRQHVGDAVVQGVGPQQDEHDDQGREDPVGHLEDLHEEPDHAAG